MDGYEQVQTPNQINPIRLLSEALGQRRSLRCSEGRNLVINNPCLRRKVEVRWTRQGYRRMSPGGEPCSGAPGHLVDVVDRIVNQYAGIYMEDR